ncbi:MAG: DNA/RNA non-specific endonuclease [Deltaproteobacteria bacterium]|nr:DNA/RNA non-specific endonuclease [Deltaproteobacteria bacterium]
MFNYLSWPTAETKRNTEASGTSSSGLTLIAIIAGGAYWYQQQPPECQAQIRSYVESVYDRCYGLASEKLTGNYGERYCFGGTPVTSQKVRILKNEGYLVGYSEERRCPLWVAYKVYDDPAHETSERPDGFMVDRRTRSRVDPAAYTRSGYDRGHMAPNYAIGETYGHKAQMETFKMSNIIPQRPELNRGPWKELEQKIANDYAKECGEVWVVTGPVFDGQRQWLSSGVEVPDACYKIIVDQHNDRLRVIAFLMPQNISKSKGLRSCMVIFTYSRESKAPDLELLVMQVMMNVLRGVCR